MQETPAATHDRATPSHRLLALLLTLPILAALAAVFALDHAKTHRSVLAMTNLVGPTTRGLLEGRGLTVCTEDMGTRGNPICFHAARMPVTAITIALGMKLFGDRYMRVAIFKTLLFLLPIELAIYIVWPWLPTAPPRRLIAALLLLAPFAIVPFLADVSNMLVEEGYSYSFLALAFALLLFPQLRPVTTPPKNTARALLFALALDAVYLSKSSMFPAVLILLLGFLLLERSTRLRLLVLALVTAAPLGWAIRQHHASGRYSIGTSLDGMNLHKGNNEAFLLNYPPSQGDSLDWYDFVLNWNQRFPDEWSFNDFHQRAAFDYLRAHPRRTLQGDLRKLDILFFSCTKVGSTASHGSLKLFEDAGLLLFRLILWTAILSALYLILPKPKNRAPHVSILRYGHSRPREPLSSPPHNFKDQVPHPSRLCEGLDANSSPIRIQAGVFLALVAACTVPYLIGFAYTRHVSVLIYPSALFCCSLLCERKPAVMTD